jgi:prepilin-type N-terminal cleavage/methylation domain-containing protein
MPLSKDNCLMSPRKERGFSLIELLIVVAIILIIAAIAIPNLLKSKMAANEASAAQSVRTVTTGETTYSAMCPSIGYSATLVELNTGAICAGAKSVIDDALASGTKSGYKFTYNWRAGCGWSDRQPWSWIGRERTDSLHPRRHGTDVWGRRQFRAAIIQTGVGSGWLIASRYFPVVLTRS